MSSADHDMVYTGNTHDLACLDYLFCGLDIILGGRHIAGRMVVHNHPSGDPEPSKYDFEVTESLIASGKLLGIQVLDHLVIGNKKYYSFNEEHPEMF